MSEISDWVVGNWFEVGTLLIQCAILATVVWYGSKMLRFLRPFFQYRDAFRQRLDLSVPREAENAGETISVWHDLIRWLQAPMGSDMDGPFRRVIRWLQAPMGS